MYKKGISKTVYSYLPVGSGKVYYPGTRVTVQGYSEFSSGSIYYSNSSGYKTGTERSNAKYGYYTYSGALYDADGERVNGSTTFFYGGTTKTLYERGSSLTSIKGLYRRDDEENWSYTPIGSAANDLYQRNAEDDEKFDAIGDECRLKLSSLVTKDVTTLTV